MDESPRPLIRETRPPLAAAPGVAARHDYEYERCGVCNVFMAVEPLAGKRLVAVTERRTMHDWALFLDRLAQLYVQAEKITLIMDNLNTHGQPEHTRSGIAVPDVPSSHRQGALGPLRIRLHSETRQLVERRGDRAQRARPPVPQSEDRHARGDAFRDHGLAGSEEQHASQDRLALHNRGCQHQADAPISDT